MPREKTSRGRRETESETDCCSVTRGATHQQESNHVAKRQCFHKQERHMASRGLERRKPQRLQVRVNVVLLDRHVTHCEPWLAHKRVL